VAGQTEAKTASPAGQPAEGEALTGRAAPMTNDDVLKLVAGGVGEEVILTKIHASNTAFALDADSILRLKNAAASDRLLAAMLEGSK
jgi:hypothetical protein